MGWWLPSGGMVVTISNLTLCLLINGQSERRMMVTKGKYDFEKNIKTLSEIFLLLRYFWKSADQNPENSLHKVPENKTNIFWVPNNPRLSCTREHPQIPQSRPGSNKDFYTLKGEFTPGEGICISVRTPHRRESDKILDIALPSWKKSTLLESRMVPRKIGGQPPNSQISPEQTHTFL